MILDKMPAHSESARTIKPLKLFFRYLYHQLAWSYDLVAYIVSLGKWTRWVAASYDYLDQQPVLELGFGTGQLQCDLLKREFAIYGVDESDQMAKHAKKRLDQAGVQSNIVRALSQNLPFPADFFGSVVSTFPAEYIYADETISEMKRVLIPGGRAVICPVAWITGRSVLQNMAAGLFRITRQSPTMHELLSGPVKLYFERLSAHGFDASYDLVPVEASQVLVILARKVKEA